MLLWRTGEARRDEEARGAGRGGGTARTNFGLYAGARPGRPDTSRRAPPKGARVFVGRSLAANRTGVIVRNGIGT